MISAGAEVATRSRVPGTGLISLGSFAFADDPGESVLVVPRVVVGVRGDRSWITVVGRDELGPPPALVAAGRPASAPRNVTFADGAMSGAAWESVVAEAVPGSVPASSRRSSSPAT